MKRRALFIGVNEYEDPQIRDLNYSLSDAHALKTLFELFGYQTDILENPAKSDVFSTIRKMTSDLAAGDLFFFFYFAGHGWTTTTGKHLLFCSDDMYEDLRYEYNVGIPFDILKKRTEAGGYNRAFVLDACRSDFITGTRGDDATTRDLRPIGELVKDAPTKSSLAVLRSCSKYEHALEIESRKHGLFTLAMMDVLRSSKESGVELLFGESLCDAITDKMLYIANEEGVAAEQTPEFAKSGIAQVLISGRKATVEQVPPQPPPPQHHQPAATQEKKTSGVAPVKPPAPAKPTEDVRSRPSSPPNEEELRRIEEFGREMFAKKRAALRRKGDLDPYRQDSAGLLIHLQVADRLVERISSASPFATLAETENAARALDGDIEALGRELAWLKENKAWRDEVRSLATEVDALDADLARFKAAELAYAAHTSGMLARTQAKAAFDAGEFLVAKTQYADAKKSLAEAVKTARSTLANLELEDADARGLAERCQWKDCIAACDRVLAIDPECDEAARLKAKASDEVERKRKKEKLSSELANVRDLAEHRQWRDCIAACDRALAIDPECDEAVQLKAKAEMLCNELAGARNRAEHRQWKDCIAACDRALAIDPKCDEAVQLRSRAHKEIEENERKEKERRERELKAKRQEKRQTLVMWLLVGLSLVDLVVAVWFFITRRGAEGLDRKAREETAGQAYQEECREADMTKPITLSTQRR